ncbi:transposable element Tc3 transposase [Trichonephila clavipes]|nr:transposable element Tc3 transposase [Trichonephila clavipes]
MNIISGKEIARRKAVKITPSCCLSEKWRIINLLDDIWMLLPEIESLREARRNRRQTAGEIARHTTQVTGRPISRFTVARRLHGGSLFARRPVRCVPLTPAHRRRRSLWCRERRNWRDNKWGRVFFTDESRFILSSDSHRIHIWRERGSRNLPSNIIERDRYGGRGVLI